MLKQMRVAVNLNMFFPNLTLLERYQVAAAAGFKLVEVSSPYSESAEILKATADKFGLQHTLINAPTGDWADGFRGLAALKAYSEDFKKSIGTALHYAKTLRCPRVHIMAGIPPSGDENAENVYVQNILYAADRFNNNNIMCLIEPINSYTVPGYFLSSYEQAKAVIEKVNRPNLRIQYDFFHAQQICGNLSAMIAKYKDDIGYIQIAQVPSREAPNSPGEIDYKYIFHVLSETNPTWIVGLEHIFTGDPKILIEWINECGLSM